MTNQELKLLEKISRKMDVLISLSSRTLLNDADFNEKRKRGTGDLANFLAKFNLEYKEIADILDAPIASVRELINRKRRKK